MRTIAASALIFACAAGAAAAPLAVGEKLTPFSLRDYTGKDVDIRSFGTSKAVVVIFMATQCPVSNAYNERMAALASDYTAKGVTVVGINANKQESVAEIADHAKQHGFSFPILKDTGNVQADRLGAAVTPEAYVFDPTWTLRYHGRIDDDRSGKSIKSHDLRAALDALVAGQDPPVKETKAFGCTIKRVQP